MQRREFITLLGGVAATWPLSANAQQPVMPVVGFLSFGTPGPFASNVTGLRRGLKEAGFIEGQNVAIEYRWAEGQPDRLPALAAELVRHQVAVIVASGSSAPALAAKAATTTIPIVFTSGGDPVRDGLVASLNRPGGNVTGVFVLLTAVEGKRLGLLHEMVPNAKLIAVLLDPANRAFATQLKDINEAARALGQQLQILQASNEQEINAAFAAAAQSHAGAILVGGDVLYYTRRDQVVALAARYAIPAIFHLREMSEAGGLMSYGTDLAAAYRLAGSYAGQILKGAKPADLPVQQSTKFEFVINMKTAKALGVKPSSNLLSVADEVIE
jgi:putative ABC transport system substrate-binding protein